MLHLTPLQLRPEPDGSISPSGAVSAAYNGSQTFTITPDSGYSIYSVSVDTVTVGALSSYTFSHVTANHTISAAFSSSDGGSGDSSGGGSSHTKTNTNITVSSSGDASTVTITLTGTLNADGSINVSLTESLLSEAIKKALEEAEEKRYGNENPENYNQKLRRCVRLHAYAAIRSARHDDGR